LRLQFGHREGHIVAIEVRSTYAPKNEAWCRLSDVGRIFGIIPGVDRLRKSVGTTAVKTPEQMRDVA
jgi:hypothetical protein